MKDFIIISLFVVLVIVGMFGAVQKANNTESLYENAKQTRLNTERILLSLETIASNIQRIDRQGNGDVVKLPDMQGEIGKLQIFPALNGTAGPYIIQEVIK